MVICFIIYPLAKEGKPLSKMSVPLNELWIYVALYLNTPD